MKELTSVTGGRFLFFDDIQDLQASALGSAAALYFGKGNFVISGCSVTGNTISAGYVYLDGKVREVPETSNLSFPVYIVPRNTTEQGMYLDSATDQDSAITYGIQFSTIQGTNSIRINSTGPQTRIEQVLFSDLDLDGDVSLDNLNVREKIIFKSITTPTNVGELYFDDDGFHATSGITTATGTFSTSVSTPLITVGASGSGKISIPGSSANTGLSLECNIIKYNNGITTQTLTFSDTVLTSSMQLVVENCITITDWEITNTIYGKTEITYGAKSLLEWSIENSRATLKTEALFTVAGIGSDDPVINVQKQSSDDVDPTYRTAITESSIMCYSPATEQYPINKSGLDMLDGEARLYVHGHMYKIGVSSRGFLYDMNNTDFSEPSAGSLTATLNTISDVATINWKAVISDTTYSGVLSLTATGLHYDGSLRIGGSLSVTSALTVGTTINAKDIYTETVRVKNDNSFVQGKSGVTTIYALHNLKFQIQQGASTSSKKLMLIADKVTCTYVGGILTSTVTQASQTLSGITVPHDITIITQ